MDEELIRRLTEAIENLNKSRDTSVGAPRPVGSPQPGQTNQLVKGTIDLNLFNREISLAGKAFSAEAQKREKEFKDIIEKIQRYGQAYVQNMDASSKKLILAEQEARMSSKEFRISMDAASESASQLAVQQNALTNIGYNLERSFSSLRDNLLSSDLALRKYGGTFATTMEGVSKAAEDFSEVLKKKMKPETLEKFGGAISVATTLVTGLLKTVGFVGKETMEYGDRILKNKDELAKFGVVGKYSSQQLMDMASKAQYTSATLEGWTKATKSLGSNITVLGGTVNDGIETFSDMAAVTTEQLDHYRRMGFSQEELTQTTADYVSLLAKQGTVVTEQMRRDGALRRGSEEYLKTIVDLTTVTGKQRDEAKKVMEVAASQYQLQVKINEMEQKKLRLSAIAEDEGADPEARARAREQMERIDRSIKNMNTLVRGATEFGGPEMAAKVAKNLATGGAITDQQMAMMLGPQYRELARAALKGEKEIAMGATEDALSATLVRNIARFGALTIAQNEELAKNLGVMNPEAMKYATIALQNRAAGTSQQQKFATVAPTTTAPPVPDSAETMRTAIFNAQLETQKSIDATSKATLDFIAPVAGILSSIYTDIVKSYGVLSIIAGLIAAQAAGGLLKDVILPDRAKRGGGGKPRRDPKTGKFTKGATTGGRIAGAATTAAAAGTMMAVGAGVDALAGVLGVGKDEVDKEQDEKNWQRMTMWEKTQSSIARGIEHVGDFVFLGNMANQARLDRIEKETKHLADRAVAPATALTNQNVQSNLASVSEALKKRGMTDANFIHATLANIMKESGGKLQNENLDYSKTSNERIRSIFKSSLGGKSDEEINRIKAGGGETFAEAVYGAQTERGKAMGNIKPGDGWKYRGRGFIQLTGRNNYAAASKAIYGDNRLVDNPDLVNDPRVASEVVAWYMQTNSGRMAQSLGIDMSRPMSAESAQKLTTSAIAGMNVDKASPYIRNELMGKVGDYYAQIQSAGVGGVPSAATALAQAQTTSAAQTVAAAGSGMPTTTRPTAGKPTDLTSEVLLAMNKKLESIDQRMAALNSTQEKALRHLA